MTEPQPQATNHGPFDADMEPAGYQEALQGIEAPSALEVLEAAGRAAPFLRRELHQTLGDACDGSFDDHPLIQLFAWRLFSLCLGDAPKWVRPAIWDAKDECRRRSELQPVAAASDDTCTVGFNFQLQEPDFDLPEVHSALDPIAQRHGFRTHGAGTCLSSGVRDVGGEMPAGNLPAMDAELRAKLGARYIGHVTTSRPR